MLLGSRGKWVLLRARGFIHFIYLLKIKVHWWSQFDSYKVFSSFDVHLKENLSSIYLTQTVRRTGADYPGLTGSRRRQTPSYCIIQIFCFALTFFPFFDGKIPFSVSVVAHTTFCSSVPPSWTSCKQKKALSKARAAELGTSPEGEKLHSDSGVFLDSHSLQDTQPAKGNKDNN